MKKITLLMLTLFISTVGLAQSLQDEVQLFQSIYGKEKRDIVSDFVELSDSQKNDFWKLYNEYEIVRKNLGKEKIALLYKYVDDYGDLNPEDAEIFMKKVLPLRKKTDNLIDSYYKKIKKKTDPVAALQFYQIENYLADLIRIQLLEEIYTTKNQ